jgi:hypothetical protein
MAIKTKAYNGISPKTHLTIENISVAPGVLAAIIANNNTPPASRQISAPRGVTRFWASGFSSFAHAIAEIQGS